MRTPHRDERHDAGAARDELHGVGPCSGFQTNQPPSGPRISSMSPARSSSTRYGDTSPLGSRSTASSTRVPGPADAIEYERLAW